jgi:putative transposase
MSESLLGRRYNHEHYHSGIALLTPASVHTGQAADILVKRNHVLQAAFTNHPERFKGSATFCATPTRGRLDQPSPQI